MNRPAAAESATRTRILFLEASTGLGGSGSFLFYMLQHLDRSRYDARISSYLAVDTYHLNALQQFDIPFLPISNRRQPFQAGSLGAVKNCRNRHLRRALILMALVGKTLVIDLPILWRLMRIIKSAKISILVLNNDIHYHPLGLLAARITGVATLVRKAGGIGRGKWIKKMCTSWVDVVIAISDATRTDQLESNPEIKRVVLIPEAVDLNRFDADADIAEARAKLGLPAGKTIIGSASRLVEGKGQEELIQAAAKVLPQHDALVYIVGSEDPADAEVGQLNKLKTLARELGIADRVIFAGWRDDMPTVMAAIDIFVHCPTTFIEGLCITNLEAMASGKPTIASRNGGMPDAVIDGVTGFIVPPGDTGALADALLKLLRNPSMAREMGRNGRGQIAKNFEIRTVTLAYQSLFDEYAPRMESTPITACSIPEAR